MVFTWTKIKITRPNVSAITTKSCGFPEAVTQEAHPKKFRRTLARNSASTAFQMLSFVVFSSLIPRVSLNFPIASLKIKMFDGLELQIRIFFTILLRLLSSIYFFLCYDSRYCWSSFFFWFLQEGRTSNKFLLFELTLNKQRILNKVLIIPKF